MNSLTGPGIQETVDVQSDIISDEIHLILPLTSSRRRPGIRVHATQLNPEDVTHYEGLPITTVDRTIVDSAFSHVDDE